MNRKDRIEKAKGILVTWENRIKFYQCEQKKYHERVNGAYSCWTSRSQSHLDRMRFQQRYFTLVYAFLRGKKYVNVEIRCNQKPHLGRLREAYAIMTGELIDHGVSSKFADWIYKTDSSKEKPIQVANPMPAEKE